MQVIAVRPLVLVFLTTDLYVGSSLSLDVYIIYHPNFLFATVVSKKMVAGKEYYITLIQFHFLFYSLVKISVYLASS